MLDSGTFQNKQLVISAQLNNNSFELIQADIRESFTGIEAELFEDPREKAAFLKLDPVIDSDTREMMIDDVTSRMTLGILHHAAEEEKKEEKALFREARLERKREVASDPGLQARRAPHIKAAQRRALEREQLRQDASALSQTETKIKKKRIPRNPEKRYDFRLNKKDKYSKSHLFAATVITELKRIEQPLSQTIKQSTNKTTGKAKDSNASAIVREAQKQLYATAAAIVKHFHPSFLEKVLELKDIKLDNDLKARIIDRKLHIDAMDREPAYPEIDLKVKELSRQMHEFFYEHVLDKEKAYKQALIEDFNETFADEIPKPILRNIEKILSAKIKRNTRVSQVNTKVLSNCLDPSVHETRYGPLRSTLMTQIDRYKDRNPRLGRAERSLFRKAEQFLRTAA